jgi:hypothetical protein
MTAMIGAILTNAYSATDMANQGVGFGLGDRYVDASGNEYIFVQASGAVPQFDAVHIGTNYVAQALSQALGATGQAIGVAVATLTSASFGWAQIKGNGTVNVLQTCSASTALFTSATAGKLDDTAAGNTKVAGIVINSNQTVAAAAPCVIATYPYGAL